MITFFPELDERLAKQRIMKENGKYNIAVLPASWNNKLLASTVVSTHRTAYLKGSEGMCCLSVLKCKS